MRGFLKNEILADMLVMVPPTEFGFNPQTAKTNFFTREIPAPDASIYMEEFNRLVRTLRLHNINVTVMEYEPESGKPTPDAVFPNNWFSLHRKPDGTYLLVLYPMLTPNRKDEVREDLLCAHLKNNGIVVSDILDLRQEAKEGEALEGTGSIVFDRENSIAYAVIGPRTSLRLVNALCDQLKLNPVLLNAKDADKKPIYHTNVIMSMGEKFCVICLEAINDQKQKENLLKTLKDTNKQIIEITLDQVSNMCGNILEVTGTDGQKKIIMSERAYKHFTDEQRAKLSKHGTLVASPIDNIENQGGGSVRCMVTQIRSSIDFQN